MVQRDARPSVRGQGAKTFPNWDDELSDRVLLNLNHMAPMSAREWHNPKNSQLVLRRDPDLLVSEKKTKFQYRHDQPRETDNKRTLL
jgi:hypothetical protein